MSSHSRRAWPVGLALLAMAAAAPTAGAGTAARPDLTAPRAAGIARSVKTGGAMALRISLSNRGNRPTGRSATDVLLSRDRRVGHDLRLIRLTTGPIGPRRKRMLSARVKISASAGAYFLLGCADAKKQVRESREHDDCGVLGRLVVRVPVVPPTPRPVPPAGPPSQAGPAPALHLGDGLDWGTGETAARQAPQAGDTITQLARVGNGLPGQSGYERSLTAPQGAISGNSTALAFAHGSDDDSVDVKLPFPFPFAGVSYTVMSVSTNGWIAFGAPAIDFYPDAQFLDFRGTGTALGDFQRGLYPWFSDLDLAPGNANPPSGGNVTFTTASDGSVAIRWRARLHAEANVGRDFQAVLFPDGRVRYDYLGNQAPTFNAGDVAAIGLSGGTGAGSLDAVTLGAQDTPARSVLYTPRAVHAAAAKPGVLQITLPRTSTFVSADPGCALSQAPTGRTDGAVRCDVPSLPSGATRAFAVTVRRAAVEGTGNLEALALRAVYSSDSLDLLDHEEATLGTPMVSHAVTSVIAPSPGSVSVGGRISIPVTVTAAQGGMADPELTLSPPPGLQIVATTFPRCVDPPDGTAGSLRCSLPNGVQSQDGQVVVTPTSAGHFVLNATIQAANAAGAGKGIVLDAR
jgi:hypothetical protein